MIYNAENPYIEPVDLAAEQAAKAAMQEPEAASLIAETPPAPELVDHVTRVEVQAADVPQASAELPTETEAGFMRYELGVAEDLGEVAVEEFVEVDEVPIDDLEAAEVTESGQVTELEETDASPSEEAVTPETNETSEFDLQAVFASGESVQATLRNPSVSPENRQLITQIAQHWSKTFGVVKAIEQAWGTDLMPTVQSLMQQLPESARSLQQLCAQTEHIGDSLSRMGNAHVNRDPESAKRVLQQSGLGTAIPSLRAAAQRFGQHENLVQTGRRLGVQNEVAFQRVNHARNNKQLNPRDFQDLASYAQPRLAAGNQGLRELADSMTTDTRNAREAWGATERAVTEAASMFAHMPIGDASQALLGLTRSLEEMLTRPNADYVWDTKRKAMQALEALQSVQGRIYRVQVATERSISSQRK